MAEEPDLVCYPWSAATWLLAGWGLATAGMSWFFPGAHPISRWLHALSGVCLTVFALWGVWRPRIIVDGGVLIECSGTGRRARSLPLASVARVLVSPRTGHRPSERDFDRLLGLRLRGGGFRWIDLRWLRAADQNRLRERVASGPPG